MVMNGMTSIVKTVSQLISGFIFMYGIYIVTHGHLTPGGGFAGGAIIAGAYMLLILGFGSDVLNLYRKEKGSSTMESAAILGALVAATIGMFAGTLVFFNNYLPPGTTGNLMSAGVIPIYNILIGIEVGAALITIFLALVIYKEEVLK